MADPFVDNSTEARLANLERRLSAIERSSPESISFYGPRNDWPGGWGIRVRIGLQSNGEDYGVERWAEDGTYTILS